MRNAEKCKDNVAKWHKNAVEMIKKSNELEKKKHIRMKKWSSC